MKFIIDNIWLLGLVILSGGALAWRSMQQGGSKVTQLQATQLLNQGKTIILDVRSQLEFAGGHIRDSKNIPLKDLPKRVGELDKFKSKTVIVVCSSGAQSSKAVSQLKKAGFNEVYSLSGGVTAWQTQGLPTVK